MKIQGRSKRQTGSFKDERWRRRRRRTRTRTRRRRRMGRRRSYS
jgi:hypothetical protein